MTNNLPPQKQPNTLTLADLLIHEPGSPLSEYCSLSLHCDQNHAEISLTTTDANPTTYSTTIVADAISDLQSLIFTATPIDTAL